MMRSAKQRYVQELTQHLVCSRKARQTALHIFEQAYTDAALPNDCTYESITEVFGAPQEVAEEYLENMTPAEKRHVSRKALALSVLLALATVVIALCVYVIREQQEIGLGTIRETSTVNEPAVVINNIHEEENT